MLLVLLSHEHSLVTWHDASNWLDDHNYTALGAGVSALHAFVVPVEADDSLFDKRLYPELTHGTAVLPPSVHLLRNGYGAQTNSEDCDSYDAEEVVYIDTSEADDGSSISDEDIAALDPVQALLNMDLGTRLCYILETIQLPDQNATEKMLEILATVARHSPRAAHELSSNARVLRLLQQQYIESEEVLTFQEGTARSLPAVVEGLTASARPLSGTTQRSFCTPSERSYPKYEGFSSSRKNVH